MKEPKLTDEERCAIVRQRLNCAVSPFDSAAQQRAFVLDLIDVLDGCVGTLTHDETARIKRWREI